MVARVEAGGRQGVGYTYGASQAAGLIEHHGHCHQKAVASLEPDVRLLRRMGIDCEVPESGCCGMAGAFGFEKDHYELSVACGERVLLPAVRQAPEQAFIVTDGFSCREQVAQQTHRTPPHLAQVVDMAIQPDREIEPRPTEFGSEHRRALGAALVGIAIAALAARAWRRAPSRVTGPAGDR